MEQRVFQNNKIPLTILALVVALNVCLGINTIMTNAGLTGFYLAGIPLYALLLVESFAVVGAWMSGRKTQRSVAF